MTSWWIFVYFCFRAAISAWVSTVLAFRRCVTHVRLAGRPHSLYSRSLFLSRSLLLSYFLLCLGRTAAGYAALENHGGGIVMPWSSPQHEQFSGRFVLDAYSCWRVFPTEAGGKFHMSCFQLARAPEGRCKQTCLYNRVLMSKMTQTFIWYVLLLRKMKTEDRHSVWFCSSCNGMADRITVCWVFWMDWTLCLETKIGTGGLLNVWIVLWKEW